MSEAIKKERDDKLALNRSIKEQKANEQKLSKELESGDAAKLDADVANLNKQIH